LDSCELSYGADCVQHPQHPWQSWRDRYLKKLQDLPPSRFNLPDSTPASPSDDSAKVAKPTVVEKTVLVKNKEKARVGSTEDQSAHTTKPTSKDQTVSKSSPTNNKQAASKKEYTVDQLAATFTTEDWESLYAFVEEIDSHSKDEDSYGKAWVAWAEDRENQTAEQWRQYYEKVIRPQWLRDTVSKREQIKKKVEERPSASPGKSQSWSQTQYSAPVTSRPAPSPSVDPPVHTVRHTLPSDSGLASEATAQQETPRYIRAGYESALKRIRGEVNDVPETSEASRPAKIRRGLSPSPKTIEPEEIVDVVGTQEQPLEISSAVTSQPGSPQPEQSDRSLELQPQEQIAQAVDGEEEVDSIASDDDVELITPIPRPTITDDNDDLASVASSTDIVHITPLPRPPQIPEDEDDDEDDEEDNDEVDEGDDDDEEASLPSNSPTPRATRYAAFDTQAILSPSQTQPNIPGLPRPNHFSSPPHHPESDASTTQSLQEFSSYLLDAAQHRQQPPPRPASPTPSTTSTASSTTPEDPDPPLSASELDAFFSAQQRLGFDSAFITRALKRTRCRPRLATEVLEAWRRGEPLPARRGVWSVQEDEMVRRGDGRALGTLGARHTVDGWGGVTERVRFLEAWEGR